jgi:hypothetical protein
MHWPDPDRLSRFALLLSAVAAVVFVLAAALG